MHTKMDSIQLQQQNLEELSNKISVPKYNRDSSKCGIVHIGVGGFHRSHEAYYTHKLLGAMPEANWGICGIGLRENDRKIAEIFTEQDCLYTLICRHPNGTIENEVIGSILDYILAIDQPKKAIAKMADESTKIVSLTITEGGYNINAAGEFDFNNPDVVHDIENPDQPKTVFGFLSAALLKRKEKNLPAFTVMSCDNVEHNGNVAKFVLQSFVEKQNPELASWIKENVSFPNSMVDRITPVTTQKDLDHMQDSLGIKDQWPVTCEPFIQWVIEDDFSDGRPPFEKVGVQFVPDVTPYEKMKLRLLNAGHSVLGIPGAIQGHPTINACMQDKVFSLFMRKFMDIEATPTLDRVQGINLEEYKDSLEERFANPNIKDSVARICSESSAKLPKFIIPTINENLKNNGSIEFAALIVASWCYYSDRQINKNGEPLEIIDALGDQLHNYASGSDKDPLKFLQLTEIFGDLKSNGRFTARFGFFVDQLHKNPNVRELMEKVLSETE
nr:mannitol dehydrogenase family protein [Muricauda sp. UBA7809]|tara:strand:+ start:5113 stop:6615 length:1503 start_codon:yes stop_codon:yes gene_type:complete